MNRNTGIRITLIGAAAAAVSIPLLAQLLRGTNPGAEPTRGPAGVASATGMPATAPTTPAPPTIESLRPARPAPSAAPVAAPAPAPAPATAPSVALAPETKGPAPAPRAPSPAPAPAAAVAAALAVPGPTPTAPATPATRPEDNGSPAASPEPREAPATAPSPAPVAAISTPASRPASAVPAPVIHDANGNPVDPEKVVINVGGEKLTADEVEAFISDLPPDQQAMLRAEGRRGLADYLVKTKLLAREARARKLDQDPRVRRQMRLVQDQVLARALVGDVREGVDDAAVRSFFEEHRKLFERVHARHILVRAPGSRLPLRPGQKELTEEQAKARATDIYNRLKAGADFARVAREESDDVGSGADGGDMGSIRRGTKVEAFEKAVYSLKEGEISPPVRSPMGWHVIQVLERFDTPEKLAEQIRAVMGPQRTQDLIQGLEKDQKVEVDDAFFGPPPLPDPAVPESGAPGAPVAPVAPGATGTPPGSGPASGPGASQPAARQAPR